MNANISFLSVTQGAILSCTRLQRAHLEGASLRGCNFEDPAGTRAHLEGKKKLFFFFNALHIKIPQHFNFFRCQCSLILSITKSMHNDCASISDWLVTSFYFYWPKRDFTQLGFC